MAFLSAIEPKLEKGLERYDLLLVDMISYPLIQHVQKFSQNSLLHYSGRLFLLEPKFLVKYVILGAE